MACSCILSPRKASEALFEKSETEASVCVSFSRSIRCVCVLHLYVRLCTLPEGSGELSNLVKNRDSLGYYMVCRFNWPIY